MDATAPVERGPKWRSPLIVMALAVLTIFALILYSPNLGSLTGIFLVAPLTALILMAFAVRAKRRARWVCLGLVCCFVLLAWQMLKHSDAIRSEARWFSSSRHWKEAVVATPGNDSGMKWVVWDGWGMFAQDTDVYLVFSPDDELRNYSPPNLHGLPCPVWRVQRLEKQWYSVTFYTNQGWSYCGASRG